MSEHLKCENVSSESPLAQLKAIFSGLFTAGTLEETNPHLTTAIFQVTVDSNEVPMEHLFL